MKMQKTKHERDCSAGTMLSIPDSVVPPPPKQKKTPTGWKQFNSANTQYPNE